MTRAELGARWQAEQDELEAEIATWPHVDDARDEGDE